MHWWKLGQTFFTRNYLWLPPWQRSLLALQAAIQTQRAFYMPVHVPAPLKTCCQMSKWPWQHSCEHMYMLACAYVCVRMPQPPPRPPPPPQWYDPDHPFSPVMRPDGLCGRQEDFTLKCVESARGSTEYSCVFVCVCECVSDNSLNKARISRLLVLLALGAAEASWPPPARQHLSV